MELLSQASHNGALMGVHFILEKGWHVYWINPGDSGQPPTLRWTLPSGASAGEIQWPRPERLQTSPAITDYGYKDDVVLLVPLRLSNGDSKPEIAVDAQWLICREVCLPDHAHLSISLAAAAADRRAAISRLFARARALLPRAWPSMWKVNAESRKDDFVLAIVSGHPLARVEFFPLDSGQIDNASRQKFTTISTGAKLVLRKSDLLLKPVSELRGVLVINQAAYQIRARVSELSR